VSARVSANQTALDRFSGNICRCTGYSLALAAKLLEQGAKEVGGFYTNRHDLRVRTAEDPNIAARRDLNASGASLRQIAAELTQRGIATPRGHESWSAVQVKRVLERAGLSSRPAAPDLSTDKLPSDWA
jgi:hypothetical protein